MRKEFRITMDGLGSQLEIQPSQLSDRVREQLERQSGGTPRLDLYRYEVDIRVREGVQVPARDVDNYAKSLLDSVTRSRTVWDDDSQVDRLTVERERVPRIEGSAVDVRIRRIKGQHSGCPSWFRAVCEGAKKYSGESYRAAGYHLGIHLGEEHPLDLAMAKWDGRLHRLMAFLAEGDEESSWSWLRDHLPKFMDLVPSRRKTVFMKGIFDAYHEGRMG